METYIISSIRYQCPTLWNKYFKNSDINVDDEKMSRPAQKRVEPEELPSDEQVREVKPRASSEGAPRSTLQSPWGSTFEPKGVEVPPIGKEIPPSPESPPAKVEEDLPF